MALKRLGIVGKEGNVDVGFVSRSEPVLVGGYASVGNGVGQ